MLQVRAVALSSYVDVARSFGLNGMELLSAHGINPADLADPEFRLSAAKVGTLLEQSAELSGVDSFGIQLARSRTFASIGPLSILLQHLPTVRDVILSLASYRRNLNDVTMIDLEESDGHAIVTFDLAPGFSNSQGIDLQLGVAFLILVGASQGRWMPELVCFAHATPRDESSFRRFFRADLEFNASFNGFACSSPCLDVGLPLADRTMEQHARSLIAPVSTDRPGSLHQRVRQAIAIMLPRGKATMTSIASNLDLHPRALQRQLASEGYTFADLLNGVRRELAKNYLANSARTLVEVAEDLGYARQGAFARWFAAEFDESPTRWRQMQLAAVH